MTIVHLPGALGHFVFQSLGYFAEAEGFVFLSGYVAGLTYTRLSSQETESALWRRAFVRARTIYFFHVYTFVILFFSFLTFAPAGINWQNWKPLLEQNPACSLLMGATFLAQPHLLDILPMYCLLILLTPLIIKQLKKGNSLVVLGLSLIVWTAAQFGLRGALTALLPGSLPYNLGDFDIFAWQLLFVGGLFFGFRHYRRGGERPRFPKAVLGYCIVLALLLFLCRHRLLVNEPFAKAVETLTGRVSLQPFRVFSFTATSVLIASGLYRLRENLVIYSLAYLGRYSLQVFSFQILIVWLVDWLAQLGSGAIKPYEVPMVIICTASLYLPAWLTSTVREHLKRRRHIGSTASA